MPADKLWERVVEVQRRGEEQALARMMEHHKMHIVSE